jgi:uncharacterized protein YbjT (DUF2867 family)
MSYADGGMKHAATPAGATGKTAIVAGATGMIGRECLELLLAHPAYARVIALVRRPLPIEHPKLESRELPFEELSRVPPPAADDAFCALGTTMRRAGSKEAFRRVDFEYATHFAYWVRGGGAKLMAVVSSVDADEDAGSFYLAVKGDMERGMREQRFPRLAIFRPSVLLGDRGEFRPAEVLMAGVLRAVSPLLRGGWARYRPIAASDVARAMIASAQGSDPGAWIHTYDEIRKLAGGL